MTRSGAKRASPQQGSAKKGGQIGKFFGAANIPRQPVGEGGTPRGPERASGSGAMQGADLSRDRRASAVTQQRGAGGETPKRAEAATGQSAKAGTKKGGGLASPLSKNPTPSAGGADAPKPGEGKVKPPQQLLTPPRGGCGETGGSKGGKRRRASVYTFGAAGRHETREIRPQQGRGKWRKPPVTYSPA